MNCKNCGAKLSSISKFCPECGGKLDLPQEAQKPDTGTIESAVYSLLQQFGTDLYKSENATKLKNMLADVAVKFPNELKLLRHSVQEGVQETLLNANSKSDEEKQTALAAAKLHLTDSFISEEGAIEAVNILASGLGWKVKLAESKTQPVNTIQPVTQSAAQTTASVPSEQTKAETKYSDNYLKSLSLGELSVLEGRTHDSKVQFEMGRRYEAKNQIQKANEWYQKAAAQTSVQQTVPVQSKQPDKSIEEKELTNNYLESLSFEELITLESRTHNAKLQNWIGLGYDSGLSKYGKDFSKNDNKACEWYQKAAEQGYVSAQCNLGYMYEVGHGVPQNYEKACEWYQKAAEQGNAIGQFNLGYMYEVGHGVPQNYKKACEWYQKAAEQGNAKGQCNLGYMYDVGQGVPQNYEKACEWYQKAAEQGNARGQCNLGYMYKLGHGVPQNYEKACEWYQKAANQGYIRAQFNLARMYDNGSGVPQNFEKACEWYQKAAEQGFVEAQHELGFKYRVGQGCAKNLQKAIDYYEKAAAQGDIDCFYALGLLYEHDLKNYAKAREWYRKLADQGDYRGLQLLERIKGK